MEVTEIIKQFIEVGGIIVVALISNKLIFQKNKNKKRLDSIQELVNYIKTKPENKWYISDLFYQISNIRMNYKDICNLMEDDDILLKLYLIQKYKRLYEYKNGKLQYANEFKKKWVKYTSELIPKLTNYFFGSIFILSTIIFAFSNNSADKITFGIYILITAFYLIGNLTWNDDKNKAQELMT